MQFDRVIARHYSPEIQMSLGQVHAIVSGIAMAGAGCKLLVFGCGNDSDLWFHANAGGTTVFLESDPERLERTKARFPHLDIRIVDYGTRTVADSLPIRERELARFDVPEAMREEAWDVVIIGGPTGCGSGTPGRSLPIYWTSLVARGSTQVFVDDYERELEKKYADRFLNASRTWHSLIPRIVKEGRKSDGLMLWSMGTGERRPRPAPSVPARSQRGAVIFLLDSAYLPGFHTLVYSLRNALAEQTHDIVVMSDDRKIQEDKIVSHFADRIIIFSEEELREIKRVNRSNVKSWRIHHEFGKYTFLKLLIFKDIGYEHHIFIDTDMVCLDQSFSFDDLVGAYDFAVAPTMGSVFLGMEGDASQEVSNNHEVFTKIRKVMRRKYPSYRTFNSGIFFLNKSIIGIDSFNKLIGIGEYGSFGYEQAILHRFITGYPGIKFESLPASYNFTYHAARSIGKHSFDTLESEIKFLHYNIEQKPWNLTDGHNWIDRIWLDLAEEAARWHRQAGRL